MNNNIIHRLVKKIIRIIVSFFEPKIPSNKILLDKNIKFTFGDQKGQVDFLVNNVFNYEKKGLKKNGFFIDLACADGVSINNTYFLEKYLGWTGILFEPNPEYKKKILENRKSKLVTDCVTDRVGEKIRFRIDNGMLGGIVSEETDNNTRLRSKQLKKAKVIEIYSTTLEKELDKINAPKIIDYLSLDVEGAEWIVLRSFPFHKYMFVCMSIERPNKDLDIILESKGYKQVAHLMNDVMYVHDDFIEGVNFNPKIKFSFTPRKNW